MSVLGLVVEYNPLHNGHLYHFNTSLSITQAEYSVCAISGNFVQRGEPALVDKWSRTRMALYAGIDLVIEIPVIYCVQSAEFFAFGSVSLLDSLGLVDTLCFGSEIGNIDLLKKIGQIISTEPQSYKNYIKEEIRNGSSFASSRAKAICRYIEESDWDLKLEEISTLLESSNNILGLEYIKWLNRLNSSIAPLTIKRLHSGYNDESLDNAMASATAIRMAVKNKNFEELKCHVPDYTLAILKDEFDLGRGPVFLDDFCQAILCNLRRMSPHDISDIMDVNEGLENRIKKAATMSGSIDELINNIKSKRYTETRIRRILMHSLIGMYKKDLLYFKDAKGPQYVRVLGFSEKGKKLLSILKDTCTIPIITSVSDYRKYDNPYLKKMIELDIQATDIYAAAYKRNDLRAGGYDFYRKPETV